MEKEGRLRPILARKRAAYAGPPRVCGGEEDCPRLHDSVSTAAGAVQESQAHGDDRGPREDFELTAIERLLNFVAA